MNSCQRWKLAPLKKEGNAVYRTIVTKKHKTTRIFAIITIKLFRSIYASFEAINYRRRSYSPLAVNLVRNFTQNPFKILITICLFTSFLNAGSWSTLIGSMPMAIATFNGEFQNTQTQSTIKEWSSIRTVITNIKSTTETKKNNLDNIKKLQKQSVMYEKENVFETDKHKKLTGILVDVKAAE